MLKAFVLCGFIITTAVIVHYGHQQAVQQIDHLVIDSYSQLQSLGDPDISRSSEAIISRYQTQRSENY